MTQYLAIDWEAHQLCGIQAESSRGGADVTRCFVLRWPEEIDLNEAPAEAGQWLKDELAKEGVTARKVLVTLPREDAVVRHLELPTVSDDELPDLVRFQASTKSAVPLDQLCLDYMPLPQRDEFSGRDVLMATISAQRMARIRELLSAAGLELEGISLSSVASAEMVARVEDQEAHDESSASLILARHGNRVELSVVRNHRVVLSHSTRLASDDPQRQIQSILVEVSRTAVAIQKLAHGARIKHAWVLGETGEHDELIAALAGRLGCQVTTVDPLATVDVTMTATSAPGNRALYAGPVGIVLARGRTSVEPLDFVNPRKKIEQKDWRQYKLPIGAAAAVVVLVGLWGYRWSWLRGLEAEINETTSRIAEVDKRLKAIKPALDAAGEVEKWKEKDRRWLDELERVVAEMGGTEQYYFTSLTLRPGKGTAQGEILAEGAAKSRTAAEELIVRVNQHPTFQTKPHPTEESDDSKYPTKFTLEVEILPAIKQAAKSKSRTGGQG